MYYFFHGPNSFMRAKAIAELRARIGAPDVVDLNAITLDGKKITLSELTHMCDAIPFLSERRLIVVKGLATRLTAGRRTGTRSLSGSDKDLLDDLAAYLQRLPESTDLVLAEDELVSKSHPLHKAAQAQGRIRPFPMLKDNGLIRWIKEAAREKGVTMEPAAIRELTAYAGNNQSLLDLEMEKLSTFAGPGHTVTAQHVRRLVSYVREESIFHLVDSLGRKDGARAMGLFHQLLEEGKEPLYVFAMITRQFRLLLQAKSLVEKHTPQPQIMKALGIRHGFVIDKLSAQSRNFSLDRLGAIYHDLQRIDVDIKTGRIEAILALDLFIADACRTERRTMAFTTIRGSAR